MSKKPDYSEDRSHQPSPRITLPKKQNKRAWRRLNEGLETGDHELMLWDDRHRERTLRRRALKRQIEQERRPRQIIKEARLEVLARVQADGWSFERSAAIFRNEKLVAASQVIALIEQLRAVASQKRFDQMHWYVKLDIVDLIERLDHPERLQVIASIGALRTEDLAACERPGHGASVLVKLMLAKNASLTNVYLR